MQEGPARGTDRSIDDRLHLLIVDNHVRSRSLLRASLEAEGHEIHEARNGEEALGLLAATPMDAVVSDVLTPGMDGFRLCVAIRQGPAEFKSIPVVLYTGTYGAPADRQLAQAVGADCYLMKPAPAAAILAAVRAARAVPNRATVDAGVMATEPTVLETYNTALIRKLEARNGELQDTLADLRAAHEQLMTLNRTLERRVTQRTIALEAANQELESFCAAVAHDLRTPLASVEGYAQLLHESLATGPDSEERTFASEITTSARRMAALIDSLLDFARSSRPSINFEIVDTERVVEEALLLLGHEVDGRDIEWRRCHLPAVRADRGLLCQVFVNLISNALKYTRTRRPAVIEIGTRPGRAEEVVTFIRDNGIGFDSRSADRLFGAFQKLHRKSDFEGVGMGLANVHRIVTRHGGSVWTEAAVGLGATFYFSLPTSAQQAL
jgi:signal transduction histidine kinase